MAKNAVERFEERWRAARGEDADRSLMDWLAEFPSEQAAIARRWLELEAAEAQTEWSRRDDELEPGSDVITDLHQRYRIIRRLGSGGQGTVYLAEETTTLRRRVALKRLHGLDRPGTKHLRLRFKQGARVLSRLSHVHICGIIEANLEAPVPYLVMSYVEGESLASKIADALEKHGPDTISFLDLQGLTDTEVGRGVEEAEAPDPESETPTTVRRERHAIMEIVALVEQVARALHFAHERGVIHRDIKPGNIMVTPEGKGVLMDFDMARDDLPRTHELTRVGDAFGTPAYMAPEMLREADRLFDRRSDVWALGVTFYQCLTLRRPFAGTTRQGLFQAILTREATPLRVLCPSAPRDLDVVLQKVLEKDPARRYQTAMDLAEDLRRVREGEHPLARPPHPVRRAARWIQRRPAAALAVLFGISILGLSVALVSAVDSVGEAERRLRDDRAVQELLVRRDLPTMRVLEQGLLAIDRPSPELLEALAAVAPTFVSLSVPASEDAHEHERAACAARVCERIEALLAQEGR